MQIKIDECRKIASVLQAIADDKVYKSTKGGSQEYKNNVQMVTSLEYQGFVRRMGGRCHKDFVLTQAGEEFFERIKTQLQTLEKNADE